MKTRVISGIVLVILLVATLVCGGYITAGVLLAVSLTAYHEMAEALCFGKKGSFGILEIIGMCVIVLHYVLMIITGGKMLYFVMMVMLLFFADAAVVVFRFPNLKSDQLVSAVFSFIYAPMMLSFIYLLRIKPAGIYLAFLPFIAWICDTCAYFAGSLMGKHKLCPGLSPKKTVEGAVGGVIGSVLVGMIFGYVFTFSGSTGMSVMRSVLSFAVITCAASIFSQIGDLIASAIKRDRGIKDYGRIIPGHGGIMDRFDSVIFITPIIFFLSMILIGGM